MSIFLKFAFIEIHTLWRYQGGGIYMKGCICLQPPYRYWQHSACSFALRFEL